jgi:hypothetical protein
MEFEARLTTFEIAPGSFPAFSIAAVRGSKQWTVIEFALELSLAVEMSGKGRWPGSRETQANENSR